MTGGAVRRATCGLTAQNDGHSGQSKWRRWPESSIIDQFLTGLPLVFQPKKSAGLNAVYHFTFTGERQRAATVEIRDQKLTVAPGHAGKPDLRVTAGSPTWLGFLAGEKSLVWALLRRKIRIKGRPGLLVAFGRCFPS